MKNVIIVYHSLTGTTETMAYEVASGCREEGIDPVVKQVSEVAPEELLGYRGIIIGSPTWFGMPAWQIKKLFDDSLKWYGEFSGKVGGAFTSSAHIAGGNETTILAILKMMLVHGMVVQGTTLSGHYGPVSIGAPDDQTIKECRALGKRVAVLVKLLGSES
ncbi:MAG: flavodoxin domain-containing protein [Candidatus Ratteibacteria bacterium]|jgi:NAD(P)H dehydrogenase (quinone)